MVDLGMYELKYLNIKEIIPEEYFINDYSEKIYESEQVRNYTKQLRTILDAK